MSFFESVFEQERATAEVSLDRLRTFSRALPDLLDDVAGLYVTLARVFSQGLDRSWRADLSKAGLSSEEERQLTEAVFRGQPTQRPDLESYVVTALSQTIRGMFILALHRGYAWAVMDVLRGRISASHGHLRNQIEYVALQKIARDDPVVALDWNRILSDRQGKKFFSKHKKTILMLAERYALTKGWNLASGSADHARHASVARALSFDVVARPSETVSTTTLRVSELNEGTPAYEPVLSSLHVLSTQRKIFAALVTDAPEIVDPIFRGSRVPRLVAAERDLWRRFQQLFPAEFDRWRSMVPPEAM